MDREKVLTWLEICGKNNDCSGCCPYSENGFGEYGLCRESLMADAYDLLKEQSRKQVLSFGDGYAEGYKAKDQEIVRCKDCKQATDYTDQMTDCSYHCRKYGGFHSGDWYCADGERRTD